MPKHSLPPQEQILSYVGRFINCPYGTPENSAKIFSGTARRQGLRLAEEDEKPGSQGESVGLRLAEALGE